MKKAIIISCFNWYEKRIKPIREILRNKQYEVKVVIADFDHIKKKEISLRINECSYIHVPEYKRNISFQRIRSHLVFGKECKKIIDEHKPDLIYCLIPPNKVADYCADYKKKHQSTRLIIDIIDLWPESMPIGKLRSAPPSYIWKRWRDRAIKMADHVFTECDLYQEKLTGILVPSKTTTIYLYKEQTEGEKQLVREIVENKIEDDVIRFAYLGSMNNIIDIDGICNVIQAFVDSGKLCELHAIGDGENRKEFEAAVKNTGCKTFFYGVVFDEIEKIRILAPCDYALNMMKGGISVGLTMKSIDYLSYGLPLINNIKGDTWSFIKSYNIGVNTGNGAIYCDLQYSEKDRVLDFYSKYMSKLVFIERIESTFKKINV